MLPTHVLGGMALGLPVWAVAPEFAPIGFLAGFLGGLFPDLDLYFGHRKTLHYPVYYTVFGGVAALIAVVAPSAATVGAAVFLLAAALHSVSDVLGAGLELRPWEANSDRAVFSHYHGTWLRPRRLVRYDGATEDLLLSCVLAAPLLVVLDGWLRALVIGAVGVAFGYTLLRRPLAMLALRVARLLPEQIKPYLPDRYREDGGRGGSCN